MKKVLLLILTLGFSQAHAVEYFKNRKMTAAQVREFFANRPSTKNVSRPLKSKATSNNPVELKPIRNGKFKAEVYKTEVTKNSDGTYTISQSQVCLVEGVAPVYDERGQTDYSIPQWPTEVCQTTIGGQLSELKVGFVFSHEQQRIFSDEGADSFKTAYGSLEYTGPNISSGMIDFSFTRDLAAKSMISDVGNSPMYVCTPVNDGSGDISCETTTGEYFSAVIEGKD